MKKNFKSKMLATILAFALVVGQFVAMPVYAVGSTYQITFDINGGMGSVPSPISVYGSDEAYPALPDGSGFSYEGYTFLGWSTVPNDSMYEVSEGEQIYFTENVELFALWEVEAPSNWITDGNPTEWTEGDGTEANPYQISSSEHLAYLAQQVYDGTQYIGYHFKLMNNIDLSGYEWFPIGYMEGHFRGIFDGNNKTITGLKIGESDALNTDDDLLQVGLFGYVGYNAVVKDLGIEGAEIFINDRNEISIGAFAGMINNATIENCYVTESVVSMLGNESKIGGFVGTIMGASTIDQCFAEVEVEAIGIYNDNPDLIVKGLDNTVGGFAGLVQFSATATAIQNSYSIGNVKAGPSSDKVTYIGAGGFVGANSGNVYNSYAAGEVLVWGKGNSIENSIFVGGFVGIHHQNEIENSYASGNVQGGEYALVGGFAGYNKVATIEQAYWNQNASHTVNNVGLFTENKLGAGLGADGGMSYFSSQSETPPTKPGNMVNGTVDLAVTLENNRGSNDDWNHWNYVLASSGTYWSNGGFPVFSLTGAGEPSIEYTVTFDKNGGDADANPTTKAAIDGGNVGSLPTAPTRTGYTFMSWNTAADGLGTAFDVTTAVTADLTVYAQWQQDADITPPSFDAGYPKAGTQQAVGSKKVEVLVKSTESGKAYIIAIDREAVRSGMELSKPTKAQVVAGVTYMWMAMDPIMGLTPMPIVVHDAENADVVADTEKSFMLDLPADNTDYEFYLVLEDGVGNQTNPILLTVKTPLGVSNSTINPTTDSFDKKVSAQADVSITMTLNGNTLNSIKNGDTTLVLDTDYSVGGNDVTIKKGYLTTQEVGTTTLTFKFSAGADQTLAITISDTTPPFNPSAWTVDANSDGTEDKPFKIESAAHLAYLAQQINSGTTYNGKYFVLTEDVDLIGAGWTPIGTEANSFQGNFDGQNKTISNMTIGSAGSPINTAGVYGLFGALDSSAQVKNINLTDISITLADTAALAGGISGKNYGIIDNCHVSGVINGGSDGQMNAGGIVGRNQGGSVSNCSAAVNITVGASSRAGGLVANNWAWGFATGVSKIENCYATGNVTAGSFTGGLVGWNYTDQTGQISSITNSYATGNVSGGSYTGGIVGWNSGTGTESITQCYWNSDANQTYSGSAQNPKRGVGDGSDSSTSLTSLQMSSAAGSPTALVDTLNTNKGEGNPTWFSWTQAGGTNNGYPTLVLPILVSDEDSVAGAKADLDSTDFTFGGTDIATAVTQNLTLPLTGSNTTTISWAEKTDTGNNISIAGGTVTVTRPAYGQGDKTVTLTATISKNGETDTKDISVTVKEAPPTDAESVAGAKTDLDSSDLTFGGIDIATAVTQNFTLPTTGSNGTTISWVEKTDAGNNISIVGNEVTVVRPVYGQGDKVVVMTATITKNGVTETKDISVTIKEVANSGGSGGSNNGSDSSTPTQPSQGIVVVIVNGEEQKAGTETTLTENGQSTVTVEVDNKVIESKIDEAIKSNTTGQENVIQILVTDTKSDVAVVQLTGDIVKKLEENTFDVSVKRDNVEYVIPAEEFTISKVAENLGVLEKDLKDIIIEVQITKLDEKVVEKYNEVAKANGAELVFPPVAFEVVAKTTNADGMTSAVEINRFSNYVERVMEIPAGVDPSKITTGIVFNADGTYSHVPTEVFQKDGKWYAKLNSLTNSNYSVVWNPMTVKSVENHWSKNIVNDLASRLVIFSPETFEPNKAITRADFAEYIVRVLGLYRVESTHENKFSDVSEAGDRTLAILIANAYGVVTGYPEGTFRPDQQITREEAMVMYQRAMKITKLVGTDNNRYQSYTDYKEVGSWATSYVQAVLSAHVFNGTTAATISPKANLTYAEAAQAIKNLLVESKLINQ